jgi:hypothetical protein
VNALLSKSPEDGLVTAIQITGQSQSKLGRVPTPIQDSLRKAIKLPSLKTKVVIKILLPLLPSVPTDRLSPLLVEMELYTYWI